MKKGRAETLALLAVFCVLGALVLYLCLSARAGLPDGVGRELSGQAAAEAIARNSPLTEYVYLSPNAEFPREAEISRITIHYMAGDMTLEERGDWFSDRDRRMSVNYAIDSQGRVGLYVEEANRAWSSGSVENDSQAVNIEVANNKMEDDWPVSAVAYEKLVDLCVDVCRRNGIGPLTFTGGADGNLTLHSMFDEGSACPGAYLKDRMFNLAREVNLRLDAE